MADLVDRKIEFGAHVLLSLKVRGLKEVAVHAVAEHPARVEKGENDRGYLTGWMEDGRRITMVFVDLPDAIRLITEVVEGIWIV